MPIETLRTLLCVLEVLRPAFTPASFALLVVLFDGWVCTPGRHAITEALVTAGVAATRDHTAFHRFFSRGTWEPDAVGHALFRALLAVLDATVPVGLVIDDTLAHHKGPKIFGLGCHLDAVRSTKKTKVFAFGHVWVVLTVDVPVPFARRSFALPIVFRLYRNEAACLRAGVPFKKKTELARELLDLVVQWLKVDAPDRLVALAIDNGYANHTVIGDLSALAAVVGAMRPDAALTTAEGAQVSPANVAADPTVPWQRLEAWLYGQFRTVEYKTFVASWARVCGTQPLRIVVVRCATGLLPLRIFFCTDAVACARAVLEYYAGTRWPIEVTFRDLKQLLGFSQSSARVEAAVLRMAPWVGYVYTVLVLWFVRLDLTPAAVVRAECRWYRQKRTIAFADILRSAQKSLRSGNLHVLATAPHADAPRPNELLPFARPRPRKAA